MNFDNNEHAGELPAAMATPDLNSDIATFIATNADYFVRKWSLTDKRGRPQATWNGAAFVGGPVWFAYRKMYWQAVALSVAGAASCWLLGLVSDTLGVASQIGVLFAFAFSANSIYRAHVEKSVEQIRSAYPLPSAERAGQMRRRGGVSKMAARVATVISLAIVAYGAWESLGSLSALM